MFGINVRYIQGDDTLTGRAYTYKSEVEIQPGKFCVVKARGRLIIAKIVECKENFNFNPSINYLPIKIVFDIDEA